MMLPSRRENYTKKKSQEEANSSLDADIKQRMDFWLEIQYRQKSGKKSINYLDKRSLTQMWKGQGAKSSDKLPKAGNLGGCDIFLEPMAAMRVF